MRHFTPFVVAWCLLITITGELRGQQQKSAPQKQIQIEVGQTIAEVQRLLRSRGIEFHHGGWAFAANGKTHDLTFDLDKNQACAVVFYSKSTQVVTAISFVTWPEGNHFKSTQSWLTAKGIWIDPDGSYAIKFLRPLRDEEKPPKRKSVYPSSTNPSGERE